jgi:hypothetical protein
MTTHPNVALMQAGYDAYASSDLEALSDQIHDDFLFHFPGRNPLAGDYRGLAEVIKFFARQLELTAGDFTVVPQTILADDETGYCPRSSQRYPWHTSPRRSRGQCAPVSGRQGGRVLVVHLRPIRGG